MPEVNQQLDPLSRSQRLFAGVLLLLLVDVIWVVSLLLESSSDSRQVCHFPSQFQASSEFTEYIFKDLKFEKPFFSTYFKTSLFSTYLLGFLVYAPWREECRRQSNQVVVRGNGTNGRYHRVNVQEQEDEIVPVVDSDAGSESQVEDDSASNSSEQRLQPGTSSGASSSGRRPDRVRRTLSSPSFVPANIPESGKSSGTEESDLDGSGAGAASGSSRNSRRVRFKQLAEVVEMNPAEAIAANLARLSYNASLRAQAALRRAAQRLSVHEVARLALAFTLPWFAGNYCYQAALADTEAAVVNILSSTSSIFTMILAAMFPSGTGDKFTLSKFFAVCFSISGVVVVSYSDLNLEDGSIPKGALWALGGSFFYSVYIVLLRRKVHHEENMDAPMFFGFVGVFSSLLLWPGLFVVHLTHNEPFELPTAKQWEFLVVNGFIGTVISELLWLWGCFYTSSLIATLAIGLTIPLSVLADVLWKNKNYEPIFIVGTVPMFLSFFICALLTHYEDWDPILDGVKNVWRKVRMVCCCGRRSTATSYVFDRHERESLINQEQNSSQDEAL